MTLGYIGSYTKKNGKGIYRFKLNDETGVIEALETCLLYTSDAADE